MEAQAIRDEVPRSLVEVGRRHARDKGSRLAYRWLQDGEVEDGLLTFSALDLQARAVAAQLQSWRLSGSRALLLYPPGLDFVTAFLGCLYAGLTAVPVSLPRRNQSLSRLQRIAEDCEPTVILSTETLPGEAHTRCREDTLLGQLRWLATDCLSSDLADQWQMPDLSRDDLALLQYTSGSTGSPKGVAVSHGNLLHNEQAIAKAFGHSDETVFVGWLPLHHDMGLIGNVLQPFYLGIPCTLMAPEAFAQKPVRWLKAISRYRATTSGAPNFAYELCLKRIPQESREDLDLSSWKVAYNGAEPIRAGTLTRFVEAFKPHGFRPETFYPCYGLAESTLFVTGGLASAPPVVTTVDAAALEQRRVEHVGDGETSGRPLVGCGRTWLGQRVVIVDPATSIECRPDQVGEIWIAGESVAQGYRHRPEESEPTFNAYLDTGEGPFLRTGDLGFLKDGELFVTGRVKDLIIISGRNHYPQDIEWTVGLSHRFLRPGCGAAVSVGGSDDEERLIVIQEVDGRHAQELLTGPSRGLAELTAVVRQAVAREHGLQLQDLVLVQHGTVPKTSSGKIRRQTARAQYLNGTLAALQIETPLAMAAPRHGSGGDEIG